MWLHAQYRTECVRGSPLPHGSTADFWHNSGRLSDQVSNRPRPEGVALGRPLQRGRRRGEGPVGAVAFTRSQTLAGRG